MSNKFSISAFLCWWQWWWTSSDFSRCCCKDEEADAEEWSALVLVSPLLQFNTSSTTAQVPVPVPVAQAGAGVTATAIQHRCFLSFSTYDTVQLFELITSLCNFLNRLRSLQPLSTQSFTPLKTKLSLNVGVSWTGAVCTVGTALAALYYQSPEPNSAFAHCLLHQRVAPTVLHQCVAPNVLHQMYCTSVLHQMFCTKCIAPVFCTKCFAPVCCTKCIDRLHSHLLHQGWLHFFHTKKVDQLFFRPAEANKFSAAERIWPTGTFWPQNYLQKATTSQTEYQTLR